MALHGDVYVNGEKLFAWNADFKETETDTGEDGTEPPVYTHVYDVVIAYADGSEIREEIRHGDGLSPEILATKVMLKAAWTRKATEREEAKRRGRVRRGQS